MALAIHWPYPGAALVDTGHGTLLVGAPTEAFKATRAMCARRRLPMPQVLVAPARLMAHGLPQFNPEFFVYDALFGPGATVGPRQRLTCLVPASQLAAALSALRATLLGPTAAELASYRDGAGRPIIAAATQAALARIGTAMAPKDGGRILSVAELVDFAALDVGAPAWVHGGRTCVAAAADGTFTVEAAGGEVTLDLAEPTQPGPLFSPRVRRPPRPPRLGVTTLGARSGFDVSGPATGFVIWIGGAALLYDGPVGSRALLAHQGIGADALAGIVLSHCHEDHMGAFVELVLGGSRPRVYTAEPIYRAARVKLAFYLGRPEAEVAELIDYVRVTPGETLDVAGARVTFFYTVHAIPSLGVRVEVGHAGHSYAVQISGDTLHHAGLDAMAAAGTLRGADRDAMRTLVPPRRRDGALYLADVGEATIHGHPADWAGNPNEVVYYHCADSPALRAFGRPVAGPGEHRAVLAAATTVAVPGGTIVRMLGRLGLAAVPGALLPLAAAGRLQAVAEGELIARVGDDGSRELAVIVDGAACALGADDDAFSLLAPDACIGLFAQVDADGRLLRTVQAVTPLHLWRVDAGVVARCLSPDDAQARLPAVRAALPHLESAPWLASVAAAARVELAAAARPLALAAGAPAPAGDDALYLVADGAVVLRWPDRADTACAVAGADDGHYNEEMAADWPAGRRGPAPQATVTTSALLLRLPGPALRAASRAHAGLALALADVRRARRRAP